MNWFNMHLEKTFPSSFIVTFITKITNTLVCITTWTCYKQTGLFDTYRPVCLIQTDQTVWYKHTGLYHSIDLLQTDRSIWHKQTRLFDTNRPDCFIQTYQSVSLYRLVTNRPVCLIHTDRSGLFDTNRPVCLTQTDWSVWLKQTGLCVIKRLRIIMCFMSGIKH